MIEVISPAQRAAEIAHAKLTLEFYGDNPERKSLTDRRLYIPAFIDGFNAGAGPLKKDSDALDFIAKTMSGVEWHADVVDIIADVVRGTGREVKDLLARFCEDCEGVNDHEPGCEHA